MNFRNRRQRTADEPQDPSFGRYESTVSVLLRFYGVEKAEDYRKERNI